MHFVRRLVLVLAVFLLATSIGRADTWSGIGSNWFASTSWLLGNSGPPTATEFAVFPDSESGIPLAVTNVQLSASTTIQVLSVTTPVTKQYTFTGANGAILTATQEMQFGNADLQALNVHTIESLRLNTPGVVVFDNAILSLNNATVTTNVIQTAANGRIDVNDGSSVQTVTYGFDQSAGEMRINSGGELRLAGDTTLVRGTTTINSGGELNALTGVDLTYNGTALLQFFSGYSVDDSVHLKATGGGDITSTSFIDVGNNRVGSLTVTGAGSTLTAGGSISDWGAGAAGNATVTISNSGVATVSTLRAGTAGAVFVGNVTGGAELRTTGGLTMGGGTTLRQVLLTVNGGTLETDALATFDNRAELNLVSGTVEFDAGATFNAGSRFDWAGGVVDLGANSTLLVDGGFINRTSTSGFIFGDNTTTRIKSGGAFATPSYFDLGNATLDMNNGFLTAGTTGGVVSDWGANGAATTATLTGGSVATYNSGLRMSFPSGGGTTQATISGGARLVSNGFLSTGGNATSTVTLDVTGGRVESDGQIAFFRGTTTTVSSAGVVEGQNVILGSSGGTTSTTVTGANSLLKARGTLVAGREGNSTLTISAEGEAESLAATIIGELTGASATLTVTGSGSKLDVGTSLTVGGSGQGNLDVRSGGFVAVTGGVSVNGTSSVSLSAGSAMEIGTGHSITSAGSLGVTGNSQLRADVTSTGLIQVFDSSVTRGVTLQANSDMYVDNATVGSLTQQAGADLNFELRGVSDFDNLAVTGAASVGGDFIVKLASGFAPTLGMEFPIFTAGSISSTPIFDVSAAPLASGLSWAVMFGPTSLGLAVVSIGPASGDFDLDGDVDGADFLLWQRGGSPNANSPVDLALWKASFGSSAATANPTTNAVPEPQAWVLGGWACLALQRSRRKSPQGKD